MAEYSTRRMVDLNGAEYWVVFHDGDITQVVLVLERRDMDRLIKQVQVQRETAKARGK